MKDCEEKYNKLIINLTIDGKKIDHANFLLFHKMISNDGSTTKDKNENVIWEIYRYDPNGIFQSGVDEYFKEIYFKPYTNLVYKGLIWEKIKELQTKGNIPDMKLGGNPSGTCALLSCYLVILSILNPMIPFDKITLYILNKIRLFRFRGSGGRKLGVIVGDKSSGFICNMRLIEDKLARYFLELFHKTNGNFIDYPEYVNEIIPYFKEIAEEISTGSILSEIQYTQNNDINLVNIM